ncbi:lysylphosphatidylglycerol synthase domain-containing protein [Actinokineospora xionganensis]|nr:lysylphosphatidylglycerol synthase domain-containing protein [Actinokineospora xionganensis]
MTRRVALSAVSLGLAVLMVVYLPRIVHALTGNPVSWQEIGARFGQLDTGMIVLMAVVWLASLLAYTVVLTNSLPGLTTGRALALNAAGSAVSNLLPFGGAAGVALTFAMARSWGFHGRPIMVMTLVSGVWNTLFRFVLPAVGIIALLVAGQAPDPMVARACWVSAVSILLLVAVVAAALYWDAAAARLGRVLDAVVRLARLRFHASAALDRLRADTAGIVGTRWPGLSAGMIGFLGAQWLVLLSCLWAAGAYPGLAQSIAVFALSRVLTTVLITPSGAGVMEGGVVLMLTAFGIEPIAATVAALLFGFWTYTVEIPFGAIILAGWTLGNRRADVEA